MRRRVKDHPINSMNNPERVVLVASDLQRQQLGVDAGPEGMLVLFALANPLCHASDAANILGDLRNHFLRAGGQLVGDAFLASAGFFAECHGVSTVDQRSNKNGPKLILDLYPVRQLVRLVGHVRPSP
jgi:hypothetical protein